MTTKEALKRLIDDLPDERAERLLDAVQDPVILARITAPFDDEPETDEERRAVADARAEVARGDLISTDQLSRDLGL
jgi:hypothetical protein